MNQPPAKKPSQKTRNEEKVLHEFPSIGKYKVRVVESESRGGKRRSLDIREYVTAEKFEGFTRRGIRLSSAEDISKLREVLADVGNGDWFEETPS